MNPRGVGFRFLTVLCAGIHCLSPLSRWTWPRLSDWRGTPWRQL